MQGVLEGLMRENKGDVSHAENTPKALGREKKKCYINYKIGNFLWQLSEDRTLGTEKSIEQQKWQN